MNKISIITACYNSAKTITDTFNSILKQKYYNIEYIVIDGSSKDETVSIIQEYSSKFLNRGIEFKWISEKDSGIYDAMNKGIALATGEVIGIINSDDYYMENNILEDIMTRFYDETVDGIYGNIIFVDKEDNSRMVRIWKSSKYQKGSFLKGWHPPHPSFFVRRKAYERYGVFDSSFRIAADYELMLRFIHLNQIKIEYLDAIIVTMRYGGESTKDLKTLKKSQFEIRKAWEKNRLELPNFYFTKRYLSKIKGFAYFLVKKKVKFQ